MYVCVNLCLYLCVCVLESKQAFQPLPPTSIIIYMLAESVKVATQKCGAQNAANTHTHTRKYASKHTYDTLKLRKILVKPYSYT